jgi:hypothetical protein
MEKAAEISWTTEQTAADERVKAKIEELAARFGIIKLAETDRWWQAFCGPMTIVQEDAIEDYLDKLIQLRANWADKSIAEAKKRGRL